MRRAMIDAALPKGVTAPCMQFSPKVSGSDECKCGHSLFSHYMCGAPQDSYCMACRRPQSVSTEVRA